MAVQSSQVKVGAYFMAGEKSDQLRKVIEIKKDDKGRDRIHYLSKSANFKNRKFSYATNKSNPPLAETFINACDRLLSADEIKDLRVNKILLSDE